MKDAGRCRGTSERRRMPRALAILVAVVWIVMLAGCGDNAEENTGTQPDQSAPFPESPAPSSPGAPTNITASSGDGQVTVSWSLVAEATGYNLYWSTSPGVTKAGDNRVAGVSSPYTQTGLANGITYYYVATASNAEGESPESAEVEATPEEAPAPEPPPPPPDEGVTAVDQEQPEFDDSAGAIAIGGASEQKLVQTITAGLSGQLEGVRMPISLGAGDLIVEIQGVTNGLPNGTVQTAETFTAAGFPLKEPDGFRTFAFAAPIAITASTQFAIVVSSPNGVGGIQRGPGGDSYPGGKAYFDSRPNTPGVWVAVNDPDDLPFMTLVKTDAVGGIVQFDARSYPAQEGLGTVSLTVLRSDASAGGISVDYVTVDGTAKAGQDYIATAGTLTWADGDTAPKVISVPIVDDAVSDWNESFTVQLGNAAGGAVLKWPGSATVTVTDNEAQASGTWGLMAPMPTPRYLHTSSVAGGKIYVFGARSAHTIPDQNWNNVEAYDPVAGTWSIKALMPTGRWGPASSEVNGTIYVFGGFNGSYLNTVEAYDPVADSWTSKAPMPTARSGATSSVAGGLVYVIGGFNGSSSLNVVEIFDPLTNTWSVASPIPTPRYEATARTVNGVIYVIGGRGYLNTVEAFDPATGTWSAKAPMPTARTGLSACVLGGTIYVMGGFYVDADGTVFTTAVELYDPLTGAWSTGLPVPVGRYRGSCSSVDGHLYFIGGYDGTFYGRNDRFIP